MQTRLALCALQEFGDMFEGCVGRECAVKMRMMEGWKEREFDDHVFSSPLPLLLVFHRIAFGVRCVRSVFEYLDDRGVNKF